MDGPNEENIMFNVLKMYVRKLVAEEFNNQSHDLVDHLQRANNRTLSMMEKSRSIKDGHIVQEEVSNYLKSEDFIIRTVARINTLQLKNPE